MNKKSTEIKKELDATNNRLSELSEMKKGITDKHQSLHKGFVSGTTPLDELQAEQSKLTTLGSSMLALQAKQSELESELESAQKAELKQNSIEQMKKLVNEAETAFNEYASERSAADKIFAKHAKRLLVLLTAFRTKQAEFSSILRGFAPDVAGLYAVPPEVRLIRSQIIDELKKTGVSSDNLEIITAGSLPLEKLEFELAIEDAIGLLIVRAQEEKKAKLFASSNARRVEQAVA
jgi:hypothetical protein